MTYKGWMDLTVWQWLNYNNFWVTTLKSDLSKGKITQAQYDAIWKNRETKVKEYRDSSGNAAAPDPTANSNGDPNVDDSDWLNGIKDDFNKLSDVIGGGKYVFYGIAGLVLIIILGRK